MQLSKANFNGVSPPLRNSQTSLVRRVWCMIPPLHRDTTISSSPIMEVAPIDSHISTTVSINHHLQLQNWLKIPLQIVPRHQDIPFNSSWELEIGLMSDTLWLLSLQNGGNGCDNCIDLVGYMFVLLGFLMDRVDAGTQRVKKLKCWVVRYWWK